MSLPGADSAQAAGAQAPRAATGKDDLLCKVGGFRAGQMVDHRANGFHPDGAPARLRARQDARARERAGRCASSKLHAQDKTLEVAPGVSFDAWTFNGRVPGPTLRAREGERVRVTFVNGSEHAAHDPLPRPAQLLHRRRPGRRARVRSRPGERTVYEFDAAPFGLHLYHCHSPPLASHIAKGLHGAFIIDPKDGRPEADELVMVMNGFDTNFDRSNEVYAANSIPFAYMHEPIAVKQGELVRIYLVNVLEYDLINSFHVHGNFFNYFPTGTSLEPTEFTDTVMLCQGQRGDPRAALPATPASTCSTPTSPSSPSSGWMGFFDVRA